MKTSQPGCTSLFMVVAADTQLLFPSVEAALTYKQQLVVTTQC